MLLKDAFAFCSHTCMRIMWLSVYLQQQLVITWPPNFEFCRGQKYILHVSSNWLSKNSRQHEGPSCLSHQTIVVLSETLKKKKEKVYRPVPSFGPEIVLRIKLVMTYVGHFLGLKGIDIHTSFFNIHILFFLSVESLCSNFFVKRQKSECWYKIGECKNQFPV